MDELLRGWGLEELLPRLVDCGITDTDALLLLGPEHSSRIFQQNELGIELKFFKNLKQLNESLHPPVVLAKGSHHSETVFIEVDPSVASTSITTSTSKRLSSDTDYEQTPKKSKGTSKIPSRAIKNLDIHTLLVEDRERGPPILQYFQTFKTFNKRHRDVLAAIVVSAARSVKEELKNDDFEVLSYKIADTFHGESPCTYYLPPQTEGLAQSISKGKLPVRYRNVLKQEKKLAGAVSAVRLPKSQNNNNNPYDNITSVVITKEMNDAYKWLETNSIYDDWPLIKAKWRLCAPLRLQKLFNDEGDSISNYLEKWPILTEPSGYCLMELDFDSIYPEKELNLLTNWEVFVETVLQLASKNLTDPVAKECLVLANTVTHSGSKGVLALNILPALCPPTTRVKGVKGAENRRLLVSNSRAGLLLHVTETASIVKQLRARRDILFAQKKKSQPFLVVVGPNLSNIKEYYVDVSGILYRINSIQKAVDVCFKAITALHVNYPPESQRPWMMIQRVLYNITTDWDSEVPYDLISSYNALCQPSQ